MKKVILVKTAFSLLVALIFTAILPASLPNTFTYNNVSVVKAADDEVCLNETSKSLVKEATFTLKVLNYDIESVQKITFKSSNSEVASVSSKGIVTANKIGNATISVTITVKKLGKNIADTFDCEITVGPPAISLKLNKTSLKLATGDKSTVLKAILKPSNTADEVSYMSTDTSIVTVNKSGRIIAKNPGEALVFAYTGSGAVRDVCSITVIAASDELQESAN